MNKQRRVIVIGGTSGIGLAIAERFASDGCDVIATGASPGECASAGSSAVSAAVRDRLKFETLDVREGDAVQAFFARQPSLGVLVNCAGIIRRGEEHDPAVFAQVIDINLNGSMRTCA